MCIAFCGSIVVFGGTNGQRPFDELWLLHVHSSKWEQARTSDYLTLLPYYELSTSRTDVAT